MYRTTSIDNVIKENNAMVALEALHRLAPDFKPYERWPTWAQASFIKIKDRRTGSGRGDRFNLWLFFWRNGIPPRVAADLTIVHGGYDDAAIKDMWGMVNTAEKTPRKLDKYASYDMEHEASKRYYKTKWEKDHGY